MFVTKRLIEAAVLEQIEAAKLIPPAPDGMVRIVYCAKTSQRGYHVGIQYARASVLVNETITYDNGTAAPLDAVVKAVVV